MRRLNGSASVLIALAGLAAPSAVRADVFNMPNGEASLQFVTVGNPSNVPDPASVYLYGSVPYLYQMGKYDVTVAQYCQFLNAVAATDTYGLYYGGMATDMPTVGIVQSGSPGGYTYSVSYNSAAWQSYSTNYPSFYPTPSAAANDCPVFDVTLADAARFCNWLQNGQPSRAEGPGTTETGVYTFSGWPEGNRNAGAVYFLPTTDEWYKAAYYNPTDATYWTYPTRSNSAPSNALSPTGTNNANFNSGTSSSPVYTDPANHLTPVGALPASPGPFGTFDMGGGVCQWVDGNGLISNGQLSLPTEGGSWISSSSALESGPPGLASPGSHSPYVGFRVGSIPWGWHDPGDANGDGMVDVNDLTIVLTNFGQTGCAWSQGCMDGDGTGTVDLNDLTIVLANFGTTYGASSGIKAVPEPSCLAILAATALLALACRRRKP